MVDKFRLHRTGTKLIDSLVHGAPNDYECSVPAITVRPECRRTRRNIVCLCRSWIFLRLMLTKHRLRNGKLKTTSRAGPLDPREVKAARQKEIWYLWDMEVYEYSTEVETRARRGRNPVGPIWIDTNKGGAEAPRYRSRLVCTEKRHKGSKTISLETLRVPLCVACQEDVFRVEDPFLVSIADVSRAHFYADAVRDVYVRLPDEDPKAKQPAVWEIAKDNPYGSLDAAQRWEEHYAQFLETGGFSRGVASPCHFFHRLGDVHSGARR